MNDKDYCWKCYKLTQDWRDVGDDACDHETEAEAKRREEGINQDAVNRFLPGHAE